MGGTLALFGALVGFYGCWLTQQRDKTVGSVSNAVAAPVAARVAERTSPPADPSPSDGEPSSPTQEAERRETLPSTLDLLRMADPPRPEAVSAMLETILARQDFLAVLEDIARRLEEGSLDGTLRNAALLALVGGVKTLFVEAARAARPGDGSALVTVVLNHWPREDRPACEELAAALETIPVVTTENVQALLRLLDSGTAPFAADILRTWLDKLSLDSLLLLSRHPVDGLPDLWSHLFPYLAKADPQRALAEWRERFDQALAESRERAEDLLGLLLDELPSDQALTIFRDVMRDAIAQGKASAVFFFGALGEHYPSKLTPEALVRQVEDEHDPEVLDWFLRVFQGDLTLLMAVVQDPRTAHARSIALQHTLLKGKKNPTVVSLYVETLSDYATGAAVPDYALPGLLQSAVSLAATTQGTLAGEALAQSVLKIATKPDLEPFTQHSAVRAVVAFLGKEKALALAEQGLFPVAEVQAAIQSLEE